MDHITQKSKGTPSPSVLPYYTPAHFSDHSATLTEGTNTDTNKETDIYRHTNRFAERLIYY